MSTLYLYTLWKPSEKCHENSVHTLYGLYILLWSYFNEWGIHTLYIFFCNWSSQYIYIAKKSINLLWNSNSQCCTMHFCSDTQILVKNLTIKSRGSLVALFFFITTRHMAFVIWRIWFQYINTCSRLLIHVCYVHAHFLD